MLSVSSQWSIKVRTSIFLKILKGYPFSSPSIELFSIIGDVREQRGTQYFESRPRTKRLGILSCQKFQFTRLKRAANLTKYRMALFEKLKNFKLNPRTLHNAFFPISEIFCTRSDKKIITYPISQLVTH